MIWREAGFVSPHSALLFWQEATGFVSHPLRLTETGIEWRQWSHEGNAETQELPTNLICMHQEAGQLKFITILRKLQQSTETVVLSLANLHLRPLKYIWTLARFKTLLKHQKTMSKTKTKPHNHTKTSPLIKHEKSNTLLFIAARAAFL